MQKAKQNTLPSTASTSSNSNLSRPKAASNTASATARPTELIYSRTSPRPTASNKNQISLAATDSKGKHAKTKLPIVVAQSMVPLGTVKRDKRTIEEIQRDMKLKKNPELAQKLTNVLKRNE